MELLDAGYLYLLQCIVPACIRQPRFSLPLFCDTRRVDVVVVVVVVVA